MSQPINNFKLGLFVLCGAGLLVAGILAFGARSYFQPKSKFETYISGDVTGLALGSDVELRGVRVGKVTGIDFSWIQYKPSEPNYIVVDFEVRDAIVPGMPGAARNELLRSAIQQGLRARIKGKGITGTSVLSLEYLDPAENPPAQVPWTPRYTYIPSAPAEIGELLSAVEKTLRNLESLDFNAMNQLVLGDLKSAGKILDNAKQFDFGTLSTNADFLLTDLRTSNAKLQNLIQDADNTVQKAQLEKLSRDLDNLTGQLQDVVTRMEPGVTSIDFNALNQTLTNTRQTIRDMDDVLTELKEYPSGFLFGKPPKPVNGVETPGSR